MIRMRGALIMDILQLQLITSLQKTMNFTRTAEKFNITQPAVSYQMKELEKELNISLFVKNTHTVTFTAAGLEFLEYAKQICALSNAATLRMQNIAAGQTGRISIAYLADQASLLSHYLAGFSHENPSLQIDTFVLSGSELTQSINAGEYDVYFGSELLFSNPASYEVLLGNVSPLELFIPNTLLGKFQQEDWSSLCQIPFISIWKEDITLYERIQTIINNHSFTPTVQYSYSHPESILVSVNAGIGFTILPSGFKNTYQFSNTHTIHLEDEAAQITSAIAFHSNTCNIAISKFHDFVIRK